MSEPAATLAERAAIREAFEAYGVHGRLHALEPLARDELLIVLSPEQWAALKNEDGLTQHLMDMLHRKVWIIPQRPGNARSVPL